MNKSRLKSSNLTAEALSQSLISATVVHLGSICQRDLMNLKEEYVLGAAQGACGLFKVKQGAEQRGIVRVEREQGEDGGGGEF